MKTIKISRRRWWRGKRTFEDSALRMPNGKQCCLGFVCRAFGVKAKDIVGVPLPADLTSGDRAVLPEWLVDPSIGTQDLASVQDAVAINDDGLITDREREKKLRAIFKRHGLKAVFTR